MWNDVEFLKFAVGSLGGAVLYLTADLVRLRKHVKMLEDALNPPSNIEWRSFGVPNEKSSL